ncbi:MAG: hypothetical protein GY940_28465, partial [bacterium]|nr:hypothetical protein [bacterium]
EKREYYPLSPAQNRLYLIHQMEPESSAYNITAALNLDGLPDRERLLNTFARIMQRHEILRTSFHLVEDNPVQRVHPAVDFTMTDLPPVENREHIGDLIMTFTGPFDLSIAPLMRIGFITLSETRHILIVDMHHIITDGLSTRVFVKEFMSLYPGDSLPELKLQYKDFAGWQCSRDEAGEINNRKDYWEKRFWDNVPLLHLPTDFERLTVRDFKGDAIDFQIQPPQSDALKQLAGDHQVTMHVLIFAMYTLLLATLSNRDDIVVGTPASGRRHSDLEQLIGMFVNTLAVRTGPAAEKPFTRFLEEVKTATLDAFENQDYPFEELVETVNVKRDAGRNPMFDTMFVMQDMEIGKIEIPDLSLSPFPLPSGIAKFDLTLVGREQGDKLFFTLEYSTALFKEETIRRWIGYFNQIVWSIPDNPAKQLSGILILPESEKQQILETLNRQTAAYESQNKSDTTTFISPRNPVEKQLAAIWSEQLEIESVSVTSDFFNIGGNSIKSLLMVSRINEIFDTTLLITDIFASPTIEKLAQLLPESVPVEDSHSRIHAVEERNHYELSHAQKRLWLLCRFEESS